MVEEVWNEVGSLPRTRMCRHEEGWEGGTEKCTAHSPQLFRKKGGSMQGVGEWVEAGGIEINGLG